MSFYLLGDAADLLRRRGEIANALLRLGLDTNTAFEILSLKIDIERVS